MHITLTKRARPILGILIDPSYQRALLKNRVPYANLLLTAAFVQNFDLFFITEDGIHEDESWVGLKHKSGKWQEVSDFPDILYNRAHSASDSTHQYLTTLPMLKQINERIGYWKWDVHRALVMSYPKAPWLLETFRLRSLDQLECFCDEHDLVYVKPSRGLKSLGVVRLEKVNGLLYYEYRGKGKEKWYYKKGHVYCIDELPSEVKKWFLKNTYVIQKGVRLAQIEDRCFDLRVLGQKNGQGDWKLYTKAKVSSPNHSITTMGLWGDSHEILTQAFPNWQILPKILYTAQEILDTLDHHFARAGEIGLDLAVDVTGQVYFLEANSMPGKKMFSGPEYEEILVNPIEYAKFLYNH